MSSGLTISQILENIHSGLFVFLSEDIEDVKKVKYFQATVNTIKGLEKDGLIKVFSYRPSKKFSDHTHVLIDRIIVEDLTSAGQAELKRLIKLNKDQDSDI